MARSVEDINDRLKEILKQVDDPELPIEEILNLYEEAVRLGTEVSEVVENNISDKAAREALSGEGTEAPEAEAAPADAAVEAAPQTEE